MLQMILSFTAIVHKLCIKNQKTKSKNKMPIFLCNIVVHNSNVIFRFWSEFSEMHRFVNLYNLKVTQLIVKNN